MKFALSSGVYARTGNEFDAMAMSWQHRWGGGLQRFAHRPDAAQPAHVPI